MASLPPDIGKTILLSFTGVLHTFNRLLVKHLTKLSMNFTLKVANIDVDFIFISASSYALTTNRSPSRKQSFSEDK
jgi:hypothetical protein